MSKAVRYDVLKLKALMERQNTNLYMAQIVALVPWIYCRGVRFYLALLTLTFLIPAIGSNPAQAQDQAAEVSFQDRVQYISTHFGELNFHPQGGLILRVGQKLPPLVWEEPMVADEILASDMTIPTRWFDADFAPVTHTPKPGRYYVYGEAPTPSGPALRRAMTCYALPADTDLRVLAKRLYPGVESHAEIALSWKDSEEALVGFAGRYDSEPPHEESRPGQWLMENATRHVQLKRQLRGITREPIQVRPSRTQDTPAPVLTWPLSKETVVDPGWQDRVDALCRKNQESSGGPLSLVIAKKGRVVFAEGYGQLDGADVTPRTPQVLYSCMKPILGIQLAMYVDRGLVKLDQPVGDFLPEFGSEFDLPMTFHACHVHATGIEFPWELAFSRLFYFHTWHEALIAQCPREWLPATRMRYGVVGVILAVRSLELLSGENYWDGLEKELLDHLGVTSAYPGGTGFSAEDLAKIGILLANRGRYGDWEFYSENTHERILPQSLKCHLPQFTQKNVRGIGLAKDERMGPNGYGHGGGGLLAIDPDTHVVVSLRQIPSEPEFHKQLFQLVQELRNGIVTVKGMH